MVVFIIICQMYKRLQLLGVQLCNSGMCKVCVVDFSRRSSDTRNSHSKRSVPSRLCTPDTPQFL